MVIAVLQEIESTLCVALVMSANSFPLIVQNIHRYAYGLGGSHRKLDAQTMVETILESGHTDGARFRHVFIEEGQDVELAWYPLIREITESVGEDGRSIVVFYDEALVGSLLALVWAR